jgi:hypothetical protein
MRIITVFIVLFAFSVFANPPVADLRVRRITSKNDRITNWSTSYGSSDKDKIQRIMLEVKVRNLCRTNHEYRIVTSFLVVPAWGKKNAKECQIFSTAEEEFHLEPMEEICTIIDSQPMRSNRTVYADFGEIRSGNESAGWVVWLFSGEELLKVAASMKSLEIVAAQNGTSAWPNVESTQNDFP